MSSTCRHNMVNFGPLAAEIGLPVWDTPGNLNGFRVLAALLHGSQVVSVSQTFRRWTEGATYVQQGDHHVWHWPTFLVLSVARSSIFLSVLFRFDWVATSGMVVTQFNARSCRQRAVCYLQLRLSSLHATRDWWYEVRTSHKTRRSTSCCRRTDGQLRASEPSWQTESVKLPRTDRTGRLVLFNKSVKTKIYFNEKCVRLLKLVVNQHVYNSVQVIFSFTIRLLKANYR